MRIGWFSSGRGPGSQALLAAACEAIEGRRLPVEIAYVFCNRERGEHEPADRFLDLAQSHGLPVVSLSSSAYRREAGGPIARAGEPLPGWRIDYDRAVQKLLEPFEAELAVLAGYQLIAPELCRHVDLINLHPAAPGGPTGLWQEVIWQLIEQRATKSGITIFLATPVLDAGPAISFCRYSLHDESMAPLWGSVDSQNAAMIREALGEEAPLFQEIRRRGAQRETPMLLATLAALGDRKLRIDKGRVVDAEGHVADPIDLSTEVDRAIGATV